MMFLIVFWQILGMGYALTDISVNCGQLMVQGYNSCEVTHNDQVSHYSGPIKEVISDLRFGLITYKCDHISGYLVSELDCTKCGFEYSEEVQVSNCQDDSVEIWLGAILGVCFAGLIGSFVFKLLCKTRSQSSWFDSQFPRQAYADDTGVTVNDEAFLKDETEQKFDQCNARCSPDSAGKRRGNPRPATSSKKKTLVTLLASTLLIKTAKACDVILVMESNNVTMYYENGKWSGADPTVPTSFTVQVGQQICIEDHVGDRVSLQVSEIAYRLRYEVVYYTCDYDTMGIRAVSSSCDVDESCRKFDGCYNKTLIKLTGKDSENKKPFWYCKLTLTSRRLKLEMKPVGCISVERKERKGELYPVYKNMGETGSVKLIVNGTRGSQAVILSSYKPSRHLTGFQMHGVNRIPITLESIWIGRVDYKLLQYKDKFYYIDASEPYDPRGNLFGDFQISLDKQTEEYAPPYNFTCHISDYKCERCELPGIGSMISRLAKHRVNLSEPEHFFMSKNNSSIVYTFDTVYSGSVRLRVGNWTLSDSTAQKAKCDIDFVASYGCTSCNESAYVVLKSNNIEKEGLISFRSNCSFDQQFIKCDIEPTKLVLKKNERICNIRLPTFNKNILISVTYSKFGHQVERKRQHNCTVVHASYGEALERLVTSDRFIGAFVKTTILFLIFGLILTIVLQVVQTRKSRSRSERGTNLVDL